MTYKQLKVAIIGGIAMFSMFFGSGNLVFPIQIGKESLSNFPIASLGLFITGIVVPFLGLISMTLFAGQREKFFNQIGKNTAFILVFLMLSLMGPFGVSARCVLVAFGGIQQIFQNLSLEMFSLIFCIIIGFICWRESKIVKIIGKYLTPWLIFSLLVILASGFVHSQELSQSTSSGKESFNTGLNVGYQTMDLLASFFFSAAIVEYLRKNIPEKEFSEKKLLKLSIISSLIGAGLLGSFYFGLVYCGAKFSHILQNMPPEQYVAAITGHVLGQQAQLITSFTIALACLTTIIILTSLFANFVSHDILKVKFGKSFPRKYAVVLTLLITYFVSLTGFQALSSYIAQMLSVFYPALIIFVFAVFVKKFFNKDIVKAAFWTASIICIIFQTNLASFF